MRTVVGTMTGTSMDGVDAVAINIEGYGESMSATFEKMASCDLGDARAVLQKLAIHGGSQAEMDEAALLVGEITAKAISNLGIDAIDLIALHGQTVYHNPPTSIQLIDTLPITTLYPCTVLTDPRQADLQLGGQGAPITPLADWIMFRSSELSTAIVNLGGFCNVTLLPANCRANQIMGFDVCCCNLLLNAIARERLGAEFDQDGNTALQGTVDDKASTLLFEYLSEQSIEQRSLGSNDGLGEYALQIGRHLSTEDLLASATKAIGTAIYGSMSAQRLLLAGGGVHNKALVNALPNNGTTEILGVPTQAREAMGMAILGALAQDGVSITLPQTTGRRETTEVVGWTQASP
jgi:anhydro-N-acetylmuramic acid kinase